MATNFNELWSSDDDTDGGSDAKRIYAEGICDISEKLSLTVESLQQEIFALQIELDSWKTVSEKKAKELADTKTDLVECEKQIWTCRNEFCSMADDFLNNHGMLSARWKRIMDAVKDPNISQNLSHNNKTKATNKALTIKISELDDEIHLLEEDVRKARDLDEQTLNLLEELTKKKNEMSRVPSGSDITSIKDAIEFTNGRCSQLETMIRNRENQIQQADQQIRSFFGAEEAKPKLFSQKVPIPEPKVSAQKPSTGEPKNHLYDFVNISQYKQVKSAISNKRQGERFSAENFKPETKFYKSTVYQTLVYNNPTRSPKDTSNASCKSKRYRDVKDIVETVITHTTTLPHHKAAGPDVPRKRPINFEEIEELDDR